MRTADEQLQGFIAQVIDQSDLRAALEQLTHQARHDDFTDLPNRAGALDFLATTLANATATLRVGLLFCDVDDFKGGQ